MKVEELRSGYARIRLPFNAMMIRPGNVISGPALFTAADSAMYALVPGHLGAQLMAVTSDMNLRFLTKDLPGDVIGEATFLKLGRRIQELGNEWGRERVGRYVSIQVVAVS